MLKTPTVRRSRVLKANSRKRIYYFGRSRVEGAKEMRDLLGSKGANLAEMTAIGLPVPPGFTITTEACAEYFKQGQQMPQGLMDEVRRYMPSLETETRRRYGLGPFPLLLSVRAGAAIPMPGILGTVLNLGLNDSLCEELAAAARSRHFARDCYRRLIDMFGVVVMGIAHEQFQSRLEHILQRHGARHETELSFQALEEVIDNYKEVYRRCTGEAFPQDPWEQLQRAIAAAFASWNAPRTVRHRTIQEITGLLGTAVNVQAMVYGNLGEDSGTGIVFTRCPSSGKDGLCGEFLTNAQGEDVVAGMRPPRPIAQLRQWRPEMHQQLLRTKQRLEKHYRDMQELEFTVERGTLWMLQTRRANRTGQAAVRIACDMVREKLIDRGNALLRVPANDLLQLLLPSFASSTSRQVLSVGMPASPGAAVGRPAFTAYEAAERSRAGEKIILVRRETNAEDVDGVYFAEGVLTSAGGMTCHAGVLARTWGKPAVTGCADLQIDPAARTLTLSGRTFTHEDTLSIDGTTGQVMAGEMATHLPAIAGDFARILQWADQHRRLRVRANADTPADAALARQLGAEGIGLCKTENLWFQDERVVLMRQMILAESAIERRKALDKILPVQRNDYVEMFSVMAGLPVTLRLLDPPLYAFLPHEEQAQLELAKRIGLSLDKIRARIVQLEEINPMLGHRGCRLCLTYPEIFQMQVRAIVEAAIQCRRQRVDARPEIMLPLIGAEREMSTLRDMITSVIDEVRRQQRFTAHLDIPIGAMIEVPRAAVTADRIAEYADFFSFGTNDLTQMTFGYSRDDVSTFLPAYLRQEVLQKDPFHSLDIEGVGRLMTMAIVRGRSNRPGLKCGICGPHGGDVASIAFCHETGLDYVSCKPQRVPVARLAAAQATLKPS